MEFDRVPEIAKYLSLTFLLVWIGRSTVWNFLPIYLENHIPSVFLVGVVTSLPALIPILLDVPVGNLVQRAGEKKVIFTGFLANLTIGFLYLTALPLFLVAGKAMEGVAKALVWNGGWSLSLKSADSDIESEAISVFLLGVNLAIVIGPVIGGYLIAANGFVLTFWLWIFTALLGLGVFASYIGLEGKNGFFDSLETLFHRKTYRDDWHHVRDNWEHLKLPFSLMFLYSIIFSFYWLAIPLLLDRIGANFVEMGLIFGFAALPKVFQFVFGDLADRIGCLKTLVILSALLVPVLVAVNFVASVVVIGGLFFLARLLSSGMSPAVHALFDESAPDDIESELTGVLETFKHSGQAIGPIMAGTVASIWSMNAAFIAASLVAAAILAVSFSSLD